ncbi:MAG: hypothetical protein EKK37_03530 [Sphingobacteriales bacterium]|nr:MAG: hypothetical protein EKK37_03530 [Sphingobacteriales bacterium]
MRKLFLCALISVLLLQACKKDNKPVPGPVDPGQTTLLLKDIAYSSLPSPYYHFEYNTAGQVTKTSFADEQAVYAVSYNNNFISEIQKTNGTNKDRLVYTYDNDKPVLIKYIDINGVTYQRCFITYYPDGKLATMDWEFKSGTMGYVLITEMGFTYYADNNVKDITTHLPAVEGLQNEISFNDHYEDYDANKNADGFALHQKFNDRLLLLPGVKLQINNPRKVTRTGTAIDYEINYTYTYNDKKYPVSSSGLIKIKSGTDAGRTFNLSAQYSYY